MPYLTNVSITFNTHTDNKNPTTILHIFVKNRSNTSADPEEISTFIGNLSAYQRHRDVLKETEINPYLAFAKSLSQGKAFDAGSTNTFPLILMPDDPLSSAKKIDKKDIFLPVVNIHILVNDNDTWKFDYSIKFSFDDGTSSEYFSTSNGSKGIILDGNNNNYSGICREIQYSPSPVQPMTDAVLTKVILEFASHDDGKNANTRLNVHITNRKNDIEKHDIVVGSNIAQNIAFNTHSLHSFTWSASLPLKLASNSIKLSDIVLPEISFVIGVVGDNVDVWMFDYQVTFEFTNIQSDGFHSTLIYTSRVNGIVLDGNNNKYSGVYQGNSFPTVTPATAVLGDLFTTTPPPTPPNTTKYIPISFLQKKFKEFLTDRTGPATSTTTPLPPLVKMRLHNSGGFVSGTIRESYIDVQSINAFRDIVEYISSPSSLGQQDHNVYFNDINSIGITLEIDPSQPKTPLYFRIDFETGGDVEIPEGIASMDFIKEFYIYIKFSLDLDITNQKIDLLSWVDEMAAQNNEDDDRADALMAQGLIHVQLNTEGPKTDWDGTVKNKMVQSIFKTLTKRDVITGRTVRDGINSAINSLLLGGVVDDQYNSGDQKINNINNNVVSDVHFEGDNLVITYSGPRKLFKPQIPTDWPNANSNPKSKIDFSPGNLSNIDHIVVLTMENRSFDHMLGYLSLPESKGGMGRTDVDGLKSGEFNLYKGVQKPSFPLPDTYFSPDPSHSYEPVHHAINGGKMDGFANSYGEEHGDAVAGNIMGYHTGKNVPVYDALVRDFAFSHRWFASHPGPTFCNRFYELTGMLNINAKGFWEYGNSPHKRPSFTNTIFDYLSLYAKSPDHKNISWKYFEHSYCFLRLFEKHTYDNTNIVDINDSDNGFFASAKKGTLPSVSFIDPHFIEFPPNANCDGPPADIKYGQELVQKVVEAVVASPNWEKTLLIITYDEHGGFYDHFPPPIAVKVSNESPIETYGVRVPAFVISPWIGQGKVFGHDADGIGIIKQHNALYFDHTSILKTIAKRFMSDYPPYMGARYAAANDLSMVLSNTIRQTQFLPFIRYNIVYNASQKSLDVRGGAITPGTQLWQYDINNTESQNFSFEDAGDGFFYVRSHRGNLYLTVDVSSPIALPGGGSLTYRIKQDVKYKASTGHIIDSNNPACQKWKFSSGLASIDTNNSFEIISAAFTNLVLKPISNQSEVDVILATPDPGNAPFQNKNTWKISSPLISTSANTTKNL